MITACFPISRAGRRSCIVNWQSGKPALQFTVATIIIATCTWP